MFFTGWANVSWIQLMIVAKFQGFFNAVYEDYASLYFPAKLLIHVPHLPGRVVAHSQHSRELCEKFENCARILINVLKVYKNVQHEWRLAHNVVSMHDLVSI